MTLGYKLTVYPKYAVSDDTFVSYIFFTGISVATVFVPILLTVVVSGVTASLNG